MRKRWILHAASVMAYVVAVVATAAAVLLRWLLDPWMGNNLPFVTLFGAVAAAVWYGGYRPALVATVLGFLACDFLFIEPRGSVFITHAHDFIGLSLYLFTCSLIIGIGEAMRLAQRRAKEGRELLLVTFASIGDAVITTDTGSRITYLNAVAESLTGWTQKEAAGQPLETVFRIVNEQTRRAVESPVTRALQEGRIVGLANHTVLIAKDGTELPIDDSASPIRDAQGHVIGCVLIFRDITGRRKAEQQLRQTEERNRSVVDNVVDGIITIDERGAVRTFNPAAERLFGYRASEIIGHNVRMLMPEPYRHEHDGYLHNYLRTGQAKIIGIGREVVGQRKDGSTFPMELAVGEFRVADRRHFTGVVRDITERKRAEAALHSSEQRLAAVLEQMPAGVGLMDANGVLTYSNALMEHYLPKAIPSTLPDRLDRWGVWDPQGHAVPPDQWPGKRALRGETVAPGMEMLFRTDKGEDRWMRVGSAPFRDEQGNIIGAIAIVQDIHPIKQAQIALRDSEAKARAQFEELSALYAVAPTGLCLIDREFRYVRVNKALADINGIQPEDHIGKTPYEVVPDLAAEVEKVFRQVLQTKRMVQFELRGGTAAGPDRIWDEQWYPVFDQQGEVEGVGVIVTDITERKRVQDALRESEQRFRMVLAASPILLYTCDRELRYTWMMNNPSRFAHLEVIGKRDDEILPRNQVANVIALKRDVLETGEPQRRVIELYLDHGTEW